MVKKLVTLSLALVLAASQAEAIVGGAVHEGPLARQSVMVLSSNGGVCSAVVVAPDVVLTAAHCVTGAAEHRVHFRDPSGEPVLIAPAAKAAHPGYAPKAVETRQRSIDLALVRLPENLPARFEPARLTGAAPAKEASVTVGGYGLARDGDPKTTGTFRTASLAVVEPYGRSTILLWLQGAGATGACNGDSGGPIAVDTGVAAITGWSSPSKNSRCGGLTQGVLVGPQRAWIDGILKGWNRNAQWSEN